MNVRKNWGNKAKHRTDRVQVERVRVCPDFSDKYSS